ncbi:hypothetical protein [Hyalangium versicolor]|uniref:hypothetical protein n=1 Tax=Hyalangium versicolor TaxID=2861190 RepID=UPI001CCBB9CE|nr:hypothetical protein [Hyalangium versicolor]
MNRIVSFIIGFALVVAVPQIGHAAPSTRLELANGHLRTELTQAMLEGAARHNIQILTDGIVFASRDDGLVANTGILGFDNLTDDDLARGTVVGLTYLSGFGLPTGFYRVFVVFPRGASTGTAQLLDEAGVAVIKAPVSLDSAKPKRGKYTTCIEAKTVSIDFHRNISIRVAFEITLDSSM